jgi:hypothetical protein
MMTGDLSMVRTINLSAEIPPTRELQITVPADVPVGPAEIVVVVSSQVQPRAGLLGDLAASEFIGMWQDRTDFVDSSEFALRLRSEGWRRTTS